MKVLILSTGTGEGHNSAAKAVKEQFEKRGIPCELADVLNFASDKASAYGRRIYVWSTVRAKKGVRRSVPGRQGHFVCQIKVTGVFCQCFVCG